MFLTTVVILVRKLQINEKKGEKLRATSNLWKNSMFLSQKKHVLSYKSMSNMVKNDHFWLFFWSNFGEKITIFDHILRGSFPLFSKKIYYQTQKFFLFFFHYLKLSHQYDPRCQKVGSHMVLWCDFDKKTSFLRFFSKTHHKTMWLPWFWQRGSYWGEIINFIQFRLSQNCLLTKLEVSESGQKLRILTIWCKSNSKPSKMYFLDLVAKTRFYFMCWKRSCI